MTDQLSYMSANNKLASLSFSRGKAMKQEPITYPALQHTVTIGYTLRNMRTIYYTSIG